MKVEEVKEKLKFNQHEIDIYEELKTYIEEKVTITTEFLNEKILELEYEKNGLIEVYCILRGEGSVEEKIKMLNEKIENKRNILAFFRNLQMVFKEGKLDYEYIENEIRRAELEQNGLLEVRKSLLSYNEDKNENKCECEVSE